MHTLKNIIRTILLMPKGYEYPSPAGRPTRRGYNTPQY